MNNKREKENNYMKENTQEKSLVQVNENSKFYKIKNFFRRLFNKTGKSETYDTIQSNIENRENNEEKKKAFLKEIRNVETEETKLLNLQKQYRNGEVKEQITKEQAKSLCDLYDQQIAQLKKSNEYRKKKLLEYRKKLQNEG